jgi:hypothetical protein
MERSAFNRQDFANRYPKPVGPVLTALRENARQGPVLAASRMASACLNFVWGNLVKDEDDFHMAECIKPCQCLRREEGRIEFDGRPVRSPIIVDRIGSASTHIANGLNYKIHSNILR